MIARGRKQVAELALLPRKDGHSRKGSALIVGKLYGPARTGTNECRAGPRVLEAPRVGSSRQSAQRTRTRKSEIESQTEELVGDKSSRLSGGTRMGPDVVDGDQPSSTIDEAPENSSCSAQVKRRRRLFYQLNLMSTIKQ